MKKATTTAIVLIFALFSLVSCQKGIFAPATDSAVAEEMLRLIPKDVAVVFFINFNGVMQIEKVDEFFNEKVQDEKFEGYSDYQKLIEMTGIDPKNDIHFIAAAMKAGEGNKDEWAVGIVNLKYEKDSMLSFIQFKNEEEGSEIIEEEYNGLTLYTLKETVKGKDEEHSFAFIDKSNIVAGSVNLVKSVINVMQKKEESVLKNEKFSTLFKGIDKGALFWGGVVIPPEASAKLAEEIPMVSNVEAVKAVSLVFDYDDRNIMAEIKLMSDDPIKNQEIADNLISLKSMGSMITIQEFNFAEVLDRIEIFSAPDHVKIFASFPEDFFNDFMDKFTLKDKGEEKK
ncbi:MAG: DUF3352 domain-containing protein [Candidatus Aminicenantes bacterium]|nr:DUF3352 domain-containing protein [Candidatus Aminicenantes bacterium]MDH5706069.1 DUF3352 domain-containing protein [Candidatus Aminicenantes bacterium]